jgi:hypothetical protein
MLDARLKAHCVRVCLILFLSLQHALMIPLRINPSAAKNEAKSTKTSANARVA